MKKTLGMIVVGSLVTAVTCGDIYYDPTGDTLTGNPNLDITQVEVTNNGIDLFVSLTVADLYADWGKCLLFLDYQDGGSVGNNNPWGRNISGLSGTDAFIGSWLDGGGGNDYYETFENNWWDEVPDEWSSLSIDWSTSTITWTLHELVAGLMNDGITDLNFEVATTGGNWGDPGVDLLGGQGGNWGDGSTGAWMHYEIPTPGTLALLALAGITRRRRH